MDFIKKLDLNQGLWWDDIKGLFYIIDDLTEVRIELTCDAIELLCYQSAHIAAIIDIHRSSFE